MNAVEATKDDSSAYDFVTNYGTHLLTYARMGSRLVENIYL